jgi:hypothetical protein
MLNNEPATAATQSMADEIRIRGMIFQQQYLELMLHKAWLRGDSGSSTAL